MKFSIRLFIFIVLACPALVCFAQKPTDNTSIETGPIRSSAAYAEILMRKTELQADLESFLLDYTEENPIIIDIRFELSVLTKDIDRIYAIKPSELSKLTLALGKMIVRKAGLEVEYLRLRRSYTADHPKAIRARRKAEIYAAAVKEILG